MSEPVQSVLHEAQEARGATFRDDDGWLWTMGFGDGLAGYEAVTGSVAIWDVYPLVKWVVTGPDAGAAIQTVFSNDVGTQQVGQVKYGAFLADDGTMVDDGTVFKHAEDRFWVFSNTSGFGDHWRAQLGGLDVEIVNRLHELPLIAVQGPRSREVLQSLTDTDLSGLGYFRFLPDQIEVAGVRAWISRTGFTGELGFELVPDRSGAVQIWEALTAAGAVPIGLDTIEPTRIESGLIIYGTDYTPGEHTPYDVSLDRMVALSGSASFLGRQQLVATAAAPPNRLKTLRFEGTELPEVGAPVLVDGVEVGRLSSRVISPRFGAIGLAMLETDASADGTIVEVPLGAGTVRATVDVLGIKDPNKLRPRS